MHNNVNSSLMKQLLLTTHQPKKEKSLQNMNVKYSTEHLRAKQKTL